MKLWTFNCWVILLVVAACLWATKLRAEDRLWVHATINGEPVRLFFDTGASQSLLFKKTAERLGLKIIKSQKVGSIPEGEVPAGIFEQCELTIWGNTFRTEMHIIDIPDYLQSDADGVLAWGDYHKNVFCIDASLKTITPIEHVPEMATQWSKFNFRDKSRILIFEILKGKRTNSIIVDTGFHDGLALSSKKWREWKSNHPQQPMTVDANFMPGAGLVVKDESWADEITVGPLHLTNVPITEAYSAQETLGSPGFEAAIGLAALKRMVIIVDGSRGVAYVNVKNAPSQPYEHNRLGAVFVPNDPRKDNDLIAHVAHGSPADKAGIENGDVLLKIDDLDATKWRTDPAVLPLSRFWVQPKGTQLRLALRRGHQTNEVSVILEDILGPGLTRSATQPK